MSTNFSGMAGGISAIVAGPLFCTMTVNQLLTTGTNAPIIWNNIALASPFMDYNTTTGVFTAQVGGIFVFQVFFSFSNATTGNVFVIQFLNGVGSGADNLWSSGALAPPNTQLIFTKYEEYLLAAGDTVYFTVNGMNAQTIDGNPLWSRVHVMLIQRGN